MTTEDEQITKIADLTQDLQRIRYSEQDKPVLRGVHPKSHGCVKANFKVDTDLKPELQVGLFSIPGKEYQATIRFSNASARVEDDLQGGKNGSRGMAIKILGIEGNEPFLQEDNGKRNQDFLMITNAAFAFADVPDYLRLTQVIHKNNDDPAAFFAPLDPAAQGFTDAQRATTLQSFNIVNEILKQPVANPIAVRYFGAAPYRFGPDRVMTFSVVPRGGEKPQTLPASPSANYLREALVSRMKESEPVIFDFVIQVRNNTDPDLNLEDATTHWDESTYRYIKVATLTLPAPQVDVDTTEGMAFCEALVYTPWHALVSHEPIGGINRLRKKVYTTSAATRLETTAFRPPQA